AQTGLHADAFDPEFVAEARPRLRIDRAAFIDCGEDRGHYRLIEIADESVRILAESDRIEPIRDAVTLYVARRIVARADAAAGEAEHRTPYPPLHPARPADPLAEMLALLIAGGLSG